MGPSLVGGVLLKKMMVDGLTAEAERMVVAAAVGLIVRVHSEVVVEEKMVQRDPCRGVVCRSSLVSVAACLPSDVDPRSWLQSLDK